MDKNAMMEKARQLVEKIDDLPTIPVVATQVLRQLDLSVGMHNQTLVTACNLAAGVSHALEFSQDEKRGDRVDTRQNQREVVTRK